MSRLILVSNRLPVTVSKAADGFNFSQSSGGVATGISSLNLKEQTIWLGWSGLPSESVNKADRTGINQRLEEKGCVGLWMNNREVNNFYFGFCNRTIWPLFHYFWQFTSFDEKNWKSYIDINKRFCDEIVKIANPDDKIWIHDYQLLLLPNMLRDNLPDSRIGFFLHIPFPSFEILRLLPWREEILEGMLGADLIGFHEYDYVRHFLSSVSRIIGVEHNLSQFTINDRLVRVDAFPMGIDYDKFAFSGNLKEVQNEIKTLTSGVPNDRKLILSVDRLDYTKGIVQRLEAYNQFLKRNPEWHKKVTLIILAVPSRTKVESYNKLKEQTEKLIGKINGQFGSLDWTPILYLYRSLNFEQLAALYQSCDAALITPLRDGMNLVAKEWVACQEKREKQGILILSEMAGASGELAESIRINPFDINDIVKAIETALEMPNREIVKRNSLMQSRLKRYTVGRWALDFLTSLESVCLNRNCTAKNLDKKTIDTVLDKYQKSENCLFLLDYDGTLAEFKPLPEQAYPDENMLNLMKALLDQEKNEVVVISGRDRETLEKWFGQLPINLVAEHGAFLKDKNDTWKRQSPNSKEWKMAIRPIMELFVERTPGSFIEEKTFSVVWHCRKSEPDLAKLRMQELKEALSALTANLQIGIFEGSKIIEVKHLSANKGISSSRWCGHRDWQFIFVAGDDYTDEDMFASVPENAITIKVGMGATKAKYRVNSAGKLKDLLKRFAGINKDE